MSVAVLILNAAYVALLASTFTRTLIWLRAMLVLAAIAFIAYGTVESIPSMVIWNIAIGSMHLFRIVRDYRQQNSVALSDEEAAIRDEFFSELADFDFHMLWCMGASATITDEVVIHRGELPTVVSLVLDGTATIERNGVVERGVRRGGLLGEMSHVSGRPAEVTVTARGTLHLHQWDQRQLASLEQVHPASARAFRQLMTQDLAAKARL